MPKKDEFDKLSEQERIASAKRGRDVAVLQSSEEWKSVADLFFRLTDHWKRQVTRFREADSIEKIAIDRIQWTCRIAGVEDFFRAMQEDMEQAKALEKEELEKDKNLSETAKVSRNSRDRNPFRNPPNE